MAWTNYTKLMLHCNGLNGNRVFVDSEDTPKTVTGHGNAQISSAFSKFGGASLKLDGSSDTYLTVPASADWNFDGDFTIDFWWYHVGGIRLSPILSLGTGYSLQIVDWDNIVYAFISSDGTSWNVANKVSMGGRFRHRI